MKTSIQMAVATMGLCLVTGCETTGYSSRERSGVSYPNYILGMHGDSTNKVHREVALPIRIAVAQVGEAAPPLAMTRMLETNQALFSLVSGIPAPADGEAHLATVPTRSQPALQDYSTQAKSLCNLAQSVGADYLFLTGGNIDTWNNPSPLKVFDITLVGGFIIPSTDVRAMGKAAGALIEVATGNPVLFLSVESNRSAFVPSDAAWEKRDAVVAQLRDELGTKLAEELIQKLPKTIQSAKAH